MLYRSFRRRVLFPIAGGPLPLERGQLLTLAFTILLASGSLTAASAAYYVGGDPIGTDSSLTDNTGGLTAVSQNGANLGQPAIAVSLTGQELLTQFRAIAFGVPAANGNLFFNNFDYQLSIWQSQDYYAGRDPQFQIVLGDPSGIQLVPSGPTSVVPDTPFGTAGVGGNNAATYDFRFDLTHLPPGGHDQSILASPLAAGDWVFGFQSWHDPTASGSLRVTGSRAAQGPLPLFSLSDAIPRGILGGQDPSNITLHWGMSLAAVPAPPALAGDFNRNAVVDAADYTLWRDGLGTTYGAYDYQLWKGDFGPSPTGPLAGDFNGDGTVDEADYTLWRDGLGTTYGAYDYQWWTANYGRSSVVPLPGDFNGDGTVGAADYTVWRDKFGAVDESSLHGGGDGLNGVDVGDYVLWRTHFGATRAVSSDGVPEPAGLPLMTGGSLICLGCRRAARRFR